MPIRRPRFSLCRLVQLCLCLCAICIILASAQNRGALISKLRRRNSSLLRGKKRDTPDLEADETFYHSSFYRNRYLPSGPYWRLTSMPGVTKSDRFRGNTNGFQYDWFHGRT